MTIAERMQTVREAFPECRLIAFADLSAGMVLSVSAETSQLQEEMNALCATAVDAFSGASTEHLSPFFQKGSVTGLYEVIIMEPSEVGVFLRSLNQPNDAFCCVCTPGIPLVEFLPKARAALERDEAASWS